MKIYLVTIEQGSWDDFRWWIDSIWDSPEKAENRKINISKKVELNKLEYENKHLFSFEHDRDYIESLNHDDENYDSIVERFYKFEEDNPEIEYGDIKIEEKELN
jgi:hypothetical protein